MWKLAKRVETKLLLIWRSRWLKWGNLLTALNVHSVVSQSVNCQKSSVTESKESTNHLPAPQPTKRQTEHCFLCYGIPFHRQAVGRVPHPYSMTGRNDRATVPARSERETLWGRHFSEVFISLALTTLFITDNDFHQLNALVIKTLKYSKTVW